MSKRPITQKPKNTKRQTARKKYVKSVTKTAPPDSSLQLDNLILFSGHDMVEWEVLRSSHRVEHFFVCDTGNGFIVKNTTYENGTKKAQTTREFSAISRPAVAAYFLFVCQKITGNGLILYHHHSAIFDMARELIFCSRLPYAILISNDIEFSWKQQHFVASARMRFTFDPEARNGWRSQYVYDCVFVEEGTLATSLIACARRSRPAISQAILKAQMKSDTKSTLLISYFMPPSETVAVHRLSYWDEALPKIAKEQGDSLDVAVLTAMNSHQNDGRYLVVPDLGDFEVSDEAVLDLVEKATFAKINYFAIYWEAHIRDFFEHHPELTFDSVVLTGNPFYYFKLGGYFKEKWGAKIILDFRDPFANNPRFVYSKHHKDLVNQLERAYLSTADYALSVNKYCLDSLLLPNKQMGYVVANGYDERIVDQTKALPLRTKGDKINFVYTGSFYADRNAEPFLAALDEDKHSLIHIGRRAAADEHLDAYPAMERYGLMQYSEVIGYCRSMDAGVIFTSGKAFEQTTKIFDYIATGIDIILVTDGVMNTGELENLTKGMKGVHWVKNKPKAIASFLKTYTPRKKHRRLANKFSRRKQTEVLYKLIMSD